jgi:hypothetical protein
MNEKVLPIVRPSHSEFIRSLLVALWANMTHLKCKWQLVRDLVLSHEDDTEICGMPKDWPSSSETQMSRLEINDSLYWLAKGKE